MFWATVAVLIKWCLSSFDFFDFLQLASRKGGSHSFVATIHRGEKSTACCNAVGAGIAAVLLLHILVCTHLGTGIFSAAREHGMGMQLVVQAASQGTSKTATCPSRNRDVQQSITAKSGSCFSGLWFAVCQYRGGNGGRRCN